MQCDLAADGQIGHAYVQSYTHEHTLRHRHRHTIQHPDEPQTHVDTEMVRTELDRDLHKDQYVCANCACRSVMHA